MAIATVNEVAARLFASSRPHNIRPYPEQFLSLPISETGTATIQMITRRVNPKIEVLENNFLKIAALNRNEYSFIKTRTDYELRHIIHPIINEILLLKPDSLTLEPTYSDSILFSIIKGNLNVYMEYFVDYEKDELDECIINAYNSKKSVITNFFGRLPEGYYELNKLMIPITNTDHIFYIFNGDQLSSDTSSQTGVQVHILQSERSIFSETY